MKVFCPMCNNHNLISDDEINTSIFSIMCEKCSQLLSVKIVVEALQVVKTDANRKDESGGKNRVSDYIRANMDNLNLPVLPILASKIKEAKQNPRCSIGDIVDLVKTDQIIASKILELANSAAYGGLVEITDLKRAIVTQLGLGANVPQDAVYPLNLGDNEGKPLDGAKSYRLQIPSGIPAKNSDGPRPRRMHWRAGSA